MASNLIRPGAMSVSHKHPKNSTASPKAPSSTMKNSASMPRPSKLVKPKNCS